MTGTTPIDTIIQGDALTRLKELPSESVDCCITSPPYFGLRDYGVEGQIGLEESPEAYVSKLVEVFREVRRVLKKEGTCWINLGDSYAGSSGCHKGGSEKANSNAGATNSYIMPKPGKPKDLIGIPWMVAFALRADGWWLRSDIIWHKPNCMPESCKDRPTKSHEYMFLLSKSKKYYYDAEAISEDAINTKMPGKNMRDTRETYGPQNGGNSGLRDLKQRYKSGDWPTKRNKRTVWTVPSHPFKEAHFATFPEKLIEPCILAGTSERGVCPECGKAWVRQIKSTGGRDWHNDKMVSKGIPGEILGDGGYKRGQSATQLNDTKQHVTIGWLPSCQCSRDPVPAVVIDPFFGAGTTGLVAKKLGRHYIGIELNEAYIGMAQKRIAAAPMRLDNWM